MKLHEYLAKKKQKTSDLARHLDLSHTIVLRWVKGTRIPRPENMRKIVAYTNGEVMPNDFYQMEEKEDGEKEHD